MKMSQDELGNVIRNHKEWLSSGGTAGKRMRLYRADLCHANLDGADLLKSNLNRADLTGATLKLANLACAETDKTYYQVARIGSSDDVTTYCVEDDNIICGCWNDYRGGTLAEFKERVESVYGEGGIRPHAKYYAQYMAAIKFFKKMAKLAKEDKR